MCKLFGLSYTGKMTPAERIAMVNRSHKLLTATQRDGFGFALSDAKGKHYVEKWDRPEQYPDAPGRWATISANLAGLAVEADCATSGEYPERHAGAFIAHARTATCSRGAENAHPHFRDGFALVHNGVVDPIKGRCKPCDSIHILDSIATSGNASKLHGELTGYLAILGFNSKGELFALRDTRAPLVVAYVPSLEAFAFASTAELLSSIVAAPHDKPYMLKAYTWHVQDGKKWLKGNVKAWAASRAVGFNSKASKAFADDYNESMFPDYTGKKYGHGF